VFNYEFDSLTHDDPVIQAVYTALREAEYRSTGGSGVVEEGVRNGGGMEVEDRWKGRGGRVPQHW
jgi:hypothetical protein